MYTVCQWCTCSVASWPIFRQLWYYYKVLQPHADVKSRKRCLYYCVCCTLSLGQSNFSSTPFIIYAGGQ